MRTRVAEICEPNGVVGVLLGVEVLCRPSCFVQSVKEILGQATALGAARGANFELYAPNQLQINNLIGHPCLRGPHLNIAIRRPDP